MVFNILISYWFLRSEPHVQSQVTSCKFHGGWSGIPGVFPAELFRFPLPVIPQSTLLMWHRLRNQAAHYHVLGL